MVFLRMIIEFCPNIHERLDCFMFLFTKFLESEWKNLPAILSSFLINTLRDKKMNILLKKMIEDSLKDNNRINPLDNNPKKILSSILNLKSIPSTSEAFILLQSSKSKQAIESQINIMEKNLKEALKRDDFEYVNYIFYSFKTLCHILNEKNITSTYKKNVELVMEILRKEIDDKIQMLNKCFLPENSLKEEDIRNFKVCIKKNINRMKCKYFHLKGFENTRINSEKEIYENNLKFLIAEIEKQIHSKKEIDFQILSNILKIKTFMNYFGNFDSIKNLFEKVTERLVKQINIYFAQENIEKINEGFCILESLHSNIGAFSFYEEYQRQKNDLKSNLERLQNQIKKIVLMRDFTEQGLNFLKLNFQKLECFKIKKYQLEKHIDPIVIDRIYQAALKDVESFCQSLIPDFENAESSNDEETNIFENI